jgi:cyclopropane-fatty-acyl-phospholipid synthase
MSAQIRKLQEAGIHPYGSEQLDLYEKRLLRFFNREYAIQGEKDHTLESYGVATGEGPIFGDTNDLMSVHYNQPLELFQAFLDRDYMAYSMAWYGEDPAGIRANRCSLEQAQREKFRLIAGRAQIGGGERILNLGCGFGSLERYLLEQHPDLELVSITASRTQADYIRRMQQTPGHPFSGSNLTLLEKDINKTSAEEFGIESFDRVFSIGVLEHVNNLDALFALIARLLRQDGLSFHHLIVSRPVLPQYFDSSKTPVGQYFPGGRVWPHGEMQKNRGGLVLEQGWYLNGLNYYRTLDEWHRRFWERIEGFYPETLNLEDVRHWNNYFSMCKVSLFGPQEGEVFGNGHYLHRKAET